MEEEEEEEGMRLGGISPLMAPCCVCVAIVFPLRQSPANAFSVTLTAIVFYQTRPRLYIPLKADRQKCDPEMGWDQKVVGVIRRRGRKTFRSRPWPWG